jgi:hypothetical protein
VPRLDALEHLGGAVSEQGHADERAGASSLGVPAREALAASVVQDPPGQLAGQASQIGAVDGLVDGLGAQPAAWLVGKGSAQAAGNLLGTPAGEELAADPAAQRGIVEPPWVSWRLG